MARQFSTGTKFGGGGKKLESESEGGQKFLPPNPLPFCPPERLDFKIRNSDFLQKKFEHQSKNTAFARRSELRRTKSAIVGREGEIVRHKYSLAKEEFARHVLRLHSQVFEWPTLYGLYRQSQRENRTS